MLKFSKKCNLIQATCYYKSPNKKLLKERNLTANKQLNSLVFVRSPKHFNKGKHKVYFSNITYKYKLPFKENNTVKAESTLVNNLNIFIKIFGSLFQLNYSIITYHTKFFFKYKFYI